MLGRSINCVAIAFRPQEQDNKACGYSIDRWGRPMSTPKIGRGALHLFARKRKQAHKMQKAVTVVRLRPPQRSSTTPPRAPKTDGFSALPSPIRRPIDRLKGPSTHCTSLCGIQSIDWSISIAGGVWGISSLAFRTTEHNTTTGRPSRPSHCSASQPLLQPRLAPGAAQARGQTRRAHHARHHTSDKGR